MYKSKSEFRAEVLNLISSKMKFIILCMWVMFIFTIWLGTSIFIGTENQWWSIFYVDFKKYGPMALQFSYLKITLFIFLSIIGLYFISYNRKNNTK